MYYNASSLSVVNCRQRVAQTSMLLSFSTYMEEECVAMNSIHPLIDDLSVTESTSLFTA